MMTYKTFRFALILSLLSLAPTITSCGNNEKTSDATKIPATIAASKAGGPKLGEKPGVGPVIDKSGDTVLQDRIKNVIPRFNQHSFGRQRVDVPTA